MSQIFLSITNMSISASYIILAILFLRIALKKAPKWITVALWGIVAVRLICPFSVESMLSLIPSVETVSPDIMTDRIPQVNTGIPIVNQVIKPIINNSFTPDSATSVPPLQQWIPIVAAIWIFGMSVLLIYTIISYVRIRRKIGTAVLFCDNIYQSENAVSPFVFGLVRSKIYLPFNINKRDMEHVVAHERAHIHRKDHLWKPLGFLLVAIHWFNPLMWLGYVLLCRDIELACDEKVIKNLDRESRADYSEALLNCSVNRRMIAACPLAFGEVGVKERVKSIINYKKPAFWMIITAVVACVVVAVCFLTNPPSKEKRDWINPSNEIFTEYEGVYVTTRSIERNEDGHVVFNLIWKNDTEKQITFGKDYSIEYKAGNKWVNVAMDEIAFDLIAIILPRHGEKYKSYSTQEFDISKKGTYRLIVSFSENNKTYKTWIEFNISKSPSVEFLREKYPEFFGLHDEDGLTVYVWQFSADGYSCYLVSTAMDRLTDMSFAFTKGASISEVRTIIDTYGLSKDKVVVSAVINPRSSYDYVIDDAYRENLKTIFWSAIPYGE